MIIATWNIERLKHRNKIDSILDEIHKINAEILVLTEYDNLELTDYQFKTETKQLNSDQFNYSETERRVVIFSKFPILKTFETYDEFTSCCAEFETPKGNLIVYGTILGILGNRDKNFNKELEFQTNDIYKFSKNVNFCYTGDLNMSFSDNYYFTNEGRNQLNECFQKNSLINLTENLEENIDHIVVSKEFIDNSEVILTEWNLNKKLSDHKGICVEFNLKH